MKLIRRSATLYEYPKLLKEDSATHITVGDLHGNAMKLIYILIEEGVLKLESEKYSDLFRIYDTECDELSAKDIESFGQILDEARISNEKFITLIGDVLADRGSNDYFTLLVLKKLKESSVDVDILLSNPQFQESCRL